MKEVFVIESKSYYTDLRGVEHQVIDDGHLPVITMSFRKSVQLMAKIKETRTRIFGDTITFEWDGLDVYDARVMDRFDTLNPKTNIRSVVTLYKVYAV